MKLRRKHLMILLGNRLLVEPLHDVITSATVIIPDAHKRLTRFQAIVRQRGTGKEIPPEIQIGTRILVNRIHGIPIETDDETELKLVHLDSVLLVFGQDQHAPTGA